MKPIHDNNQLKKAGVNSKPLTWFEFAVLASVTLIVVIGIISSRIAVNWFENVYVIEDGFIETLTLFPLLAAAVTSGVYLVKLTKQKSRTFSVVMGCICVFSIFIAGEEISWGQRVFDRSSSDFFTQYNAQQETNLHNLVVGDKKINKIVFSQLMTVGVAAYLIALPVLYSKKEYWKSLIDSIGIPVPRPYQIWSCILLFLSIAFIPSGKNAEILEVGIVHLFLLILLYPRNMHVFRKA